MATSTLPSAMLLMRRTIAGLVFADGSNHGDGVELNILDDRNLHFRHLLGSSVEAACNPNARSGHP